jgi:cytochrome c biogenesis protein CcmG/thiol:disulfide interchange protein DsbE
VIKTIATTFLALLILGSPVSSADEALDLAGYEGKVVVLDFWASWCVPCRRSFPWWNTMQAKYADEGLVIIGVNLDNDLQEAEKFLEEFSADFKIYYDQDKALAKQYGVQAMPSTYILGRDGELVARHFGFKVKQQDEYEAVLVEALEAGE